MKIIGLDNKNYNWNLSNHVPLGSEEHGSQYHTRCRELLQKLFPLGQRLEEIYLPGSGSLYADFFLPSRMLVVEVHGQQHYEHIPFFHKTKLDFIRALGRDSAKESWCGRNNIRYVALKWSDTDEYWTKQIFDFGTKTSSDQ